MSLPKRLAASATFLHEHDTSHYGLEPFTPSARQIPRRFVVEGHETGNLRSSICGLCHHYSFGQKGHPQSDGNHHVIQIRNECTHQGQQNDGITLKTMGQFEVNNEDSLLT